VKETIMIGLQLIECLMLSVLSVSVTNDGWIERLMSYIN